MIEAGTVLAIPFSHAKASGGSQYGMVSTVGKTGASEQGFRLRAWFSAKPGGEPLPGSACARYQGSDDVVRWNQGKDFSGFCRLPDAAGTAYLNYALCNSESSDFTCSGSKVEFAPADYRFLIAPSVRAY